MPVAIERWHCNWGRRRTLSERLVEGTTSAVPVASGYDRRTTGPWISGESTIPLLVERHLDLLLAIRDRLNTH